MKKIILPLISAPTIIMPIIAVSCSENSKEYKPEYIKNVSSIFSSDVVSMLGKRIDEQIKDDNFYLIKGIVLTDENLDDDDARFDFKSRQILVSSYNIRNKN